MNRRPKPVTIGIGDAERSISTPYVLMVRELVDFGVATSGFGGRSFTLGLADIVSVVAPSAPLAEMVTVSIGDLPPARVAEALERGKAVAERLKGEGSISEAVIFLKGDMVTTVKNDVNIRLEVARGN